MSKDIKNGRWFTVKTPEQHKNLKAYGSLAPREGYFARVQIGEYAGPGRYMLLQYSQRCPRNCCYDDVNNVYAAEDVIDEVREEIRRLAEVMKQAKALN